MNADSQSPNDKANLINTTIESIVGIIEQPREREILSRRFGLRGKKETLEQIGERLDITRERVRQLEKAALIRLKIAAEKGEIEHLPEVEKLIIRALAEAGRITRTEILAEKFTGEQPSDKMLLNFIFIGEVSNKLTTINENDKYHSSIANSSYGDERQIKSAIDEIVKAIKKNKSPISLDELDEQFEYEHPSQIEALAGASKLLATLNGMWGLAKWPSVNPKNIRDKIFVILEANKKPLHF